MLPETPATAVAGAPPAKYADTGVPASIARAVALGARPSRLEAALVGGASMFALAGGQEIGARNEEAVLEALGRERVRVVTSMTGGTRGRTMRVHLAGPNALPAVTVRDAGGSDVPLNLERTLAPAA